MKKMMLIISVLFFLSLFYGIALAKKDPQCVRSCGIEINSCQNGCNSAINSCKGSCDSKCTAGDNRISQTCVIACLTSCEADSSCTERCLSENKSCMASCPDN
jgi:hypothetical protein